jgi:hypothetical protein
MASMSESPVTDMEDQAHSVVVEDRNQARAYLSVAHARSYLLACGWELEEEGNAWATYRKNGVMGQRRVRIPLRAGASDWPACMAVSIADIAAASAERPSLILYQMAGMVNGSHHAKITMMRARDMLREAQLLLRGAGCKVGENELEKARTAFDQRLMELTWEATANRHG